MNFKTYLPVLIFILSGGIANFGCRTAPFVVGVERAGVGYKTAIHDDLAALPDPRNKTVIAVYKFRDQTGQYKTSESSTTFSTAVSQGATSMLNKALEDSGWFITIEREGLHNLLNERNIIRSTRLTYNDGSHTAPLPPLLYAGVLLEGGIISYDTNVITGGAGIRYFGAGGFGRVHKDQITVYLRLISVKTGEIIKTVTATKSILSREVDFGVYRFVRENRLLEMEAGYTTNEPATLCVLEAIEKAVFDLIVDGIRDGIWYLANSEDMNSPVIQNYLREKGYIHDQDEAANEVGESTSNGTPVGITAHAVKRDAAHQVTYSLYDDAEGRFQIDPHTGIVTVKDNRLLDCEHQVTHSVTVQGIYADGSSIRQSFLIRLTDDNTEHHVHSLTDIDNTPNTISENIASGTPVGITALALDQDISDTVTYALANDANECFQIDPNSGIVSVHKNHFLDYEKHAVHTITVRASSTDGSWKVESFSIHLANDNYEFSVASITDTAQAANEVSESAPNGTPVGITVLAVDADANDVVSYALSDDAEGRFQIDPHTGIVTVKDNRLLDYETYTTHTITVRASSTDGSWRMGSFSINLMDDNHEFSVEYITDTAQAANEVSESAPNGTPVGIIVLAIDADANDTVSYLLSDDAEGRFQIDPHTGIVSVRDNRLLDYETYAMHTITVQATSTDGSLHTQTFTIHVMDNPRESTESTKPSAEPNNI